MVKQTCSVTIVKTRCLNHTNVTRHPRKGVMIVAVMTTHLTIARRAKFVSSVDPPTTFLVTAQTVRQILLLHGEQGQTILTLVRLTCRRKEFPLPRQQTQQLLHPRPSLVSLIFQIFLRVMYSKSQPVKPR